MRKLLLSSSAITMVVMVINFLFKIFLSYKIPKYELGIFYTFMDLVALGVIFFAGFKDSLIKAYDEENFESVVYGYFIVFWAIFGVSLIIELIYYHYFFRDAILSKLHLALLLFINSLVLFFSFLNASQKIYKVMLFENLVTAVGLVIFFFILYPFFDLKIEVLFLAFFSSYLSRLLYILFYSPMKISWNKSSLLSLKKFFKNSLFSSLMYFFSLLFVTSSSLVILKLFGDRDFLAEYQVVIRSIFFSLVAIFVFPLNSFTFPQISKLIAIKNLKELKRIESILIKFLIAFELLLLIATFFTKWAVAILFPSTYANSYIMLNLMLPILPFIAYTTFAINIIKGFDRFDLALYVRILGSLLFFGSASLFYLLNFNAESIVYSLDISFLGMFLLSLYFKRLCLN